MKKVEVFSFDSSDRQNFICSLQKGDTIPAWLIERWTGYERTHTNYRGSLQGLKRQVERLRPDLCVREKNYDLLIMQDNEAARHKRRLGDIFTRAKCRNYVHYLERINTNNLNQREKEDYFSHIPRIAQALILESCQQKLFTAKVAR